MTRATETAEARHYLRTFCRLFNGLKLLVRINLGYMDIPCVWHAGRVTSTHDRYDCTDKQAQRNRCPWRWFVLRLIRVSTLETC